MNLEAFLYNFLHFKETCGAVTCVFTSWNTYFDNLFVWFMFFFSKRFCIYSFHVFYVQPYFLHYKNKITNEISLLHIPKYETLINKMMKKAGVSLLYITFKCVSKMMRHTFGYIVLFLHSYSNLLHIEVLLLWKSGMKKMKLERLKGPVIGYFYIWKVVTVRRVKKCNGCLTCFFFSYTVIIMYSSCGGLL